MRAWLFQDHRQKEKLGEEAPWSVGWIDPNGTRRSKRIGSKSRAEFRKELEAKITVGMKPQSRRCTLDALNHFERLIKPHRIGTIKAQTIDEFVVQRREECGQHDNKVSPATVNKELRHIRAALRIAHEWGYLAHAPRVRMLKEPKKLPRYVTPEDFAKIYQACDSAKRPGKLPFSPEDWWRALITFAYMTGWRIGEILALR